MNTNRHREDRAPYDWQCAHPRACDHPDCSDEGRYRAPRDVQALDSYYWFCLEHVRDYNRNWNFYAGRSAEEIEADVRLDTVWRRPTWKFGTAGGRRHFGPDGFDDPLGVFGDEQPRRGTAGRDRPRDDEETRAFRTLGFDGRVELSAVKQRYKELAKRHHPDANGGCKASEERLKSINEAYMTLRRILTP